MLTITISIVVAALIGAALSALALRTKAQQDVLDAHKEQEALRTQLQELATAKARLEADAAHASELAGQLRTKEADLQKIQEELSATKADLATATTSVREMAKSRDEVLHAKDESFKLQLEEKERSLQAQLEEKQRAIDEQKATLERAELKLADTFESLSSKTLQGATEQLIKLAESKFATTKEEADGQLKLRQQAIENLIKPISEQMAKIEAQTKEMEVKRVSAYDSVKTHIESLQKQTAALANAFQRPCIRGIWGELTLRNAADQAGLVEGQDYQIQDTTETEDGKLRADMIVRFPNGRAIVVDAKTPLDSYREAANAEDEATRQAHLANHAKLVRSHIKALGSKGYQNQYQGVDAVIMFLPAESIYHAAMQYDATLLEEASRNKVILVNPMSLVGLLRCIAYVLDQERLNKNALAVSEIGKKLYDGIVTYSNHVTDLGKQLRKSVESYNRSVGSLERTVLPKARSLKSKGVGGDSVIPELNEVDVLPTTFKSEELCLGSGAGH